MKPTHIGVVVLVGLALPFLVRPLPAQECLLIASSGRDAITVFDLGAQQVTANIPVRERPVAVAVSPEGRLAFSVNTNDHSVSVVDLEAGTSVDHIPVGMFPLDLAAHPDGERLYVTDQRVSIIDIATRRVVGGINVGAGPAGIVIGKDGSRAYVANFRSNSVSVLDLDAARVVDTIAVGEQPFALALSPDESRLYVANTVSETLSVVTLSNRAVTTVALNGFPSDLAVHPDGSSIYVNRAFPIGDVAVIEATTDSVRTAIPVDLGAELSGMAASVDGSTLFVVDFILGNLFFVDTRREELSHFEPIGGVGSEPQALELAHIPSGCPRPPTPRLAAALGVDDLEIRVDRPDALPIGGTLMIDAELVTYLSVFFDRLREVTRGVRGTTASTHAAGTLVHLVGIPPDANCDGRAGAADLVDVIRQLPQGDPGPCGGDVDRDEVVTEADLEAAIAALYGR